MKKMRHMRTLLATSALAFVVMISPLGIKVAAAQWFCVNTFGAPQYCEVGATPCFWCYDGTMHADCGDPDFNPYDSCNPCSCSNSPDAGG